MARKYEFQPDKPRVSLINKLYLTQQQRRALLKWSLYALLLLVLSLLQDVVFCRWRLFGATIELIPCAIFLICFMEGAEKGGAFALVSSAIYVFSGTAAGPYSLILITFIGVFVCIFRQGYLQKGFGAAMLCTAVSMVTYEMALFGLGLFLQLTTAQRVTGFLLTAAMTMILAPFIYVLVRSVSRIGGQEWTE